MSSMRGNRPLVGRLHAGDLRDVIAIDRTDLVDDEAGGQEAAPGGDGWVELVKRTRAKVVALTGQTAVQAMIERKSQLWRITIRARDGLDTTMRVRWKGTPMRINGIAPTELLDGLVLMTESGPGVI